MVASRVRDRGPANHENHEVRFMVEGVCARPSSSQDAPWDVRPRRAAGLGVNPRRLSMTWETPQACDFRFGFEITMYVAAR
jgi:coenzyme PQQ precursor peptide PqqA